MDSKPSLKFISIVVLVMFTSLVAIFSLDFDVSESEMDSNLRASTYSSQNAEMDSTGDLYFYMEGDNWLKESIEGEFRDKIWKIHSFANLKEKYNDSLLAVSVIKDDIVYNPFFPRSEVKIFVYYSLTGNSSYFGGLKQSYLGGKAPLVQFKTSQGPRYIKQGVFTFKDSTRGFISWKAYKKKIGEGLARRTIGETFN